MALDAINRFNSLVSRLDPARQSETLSSSVSALAGIGNIAAIRLPSSASVSLSDAGQLRGALESLERDLARRSSPASVLPVQAKSSDSTVLLANADKANKTLGALNISVNQLAQGQKLRSAAFVDEDRSIVGTGALQIRFGNYNVGTNDFTPDSNPARSLTINSSNGTLSGIATAINRADLGLSAKVIKEDNLYHLEISAKQTGRDQAFRITVGDDDGRSRDSISGLSRLAYDPEEVPGTGANLRLERAAQDAKLSINDVARTSARNQYEDVESGIRLTLKSTGEAKVEFSRQQETANEAANRLAQSVNRFVERANELQGSGLSRKLINDVADAVSNAETGSGLDRLTLSAIGITVTRDQQDRMTAIKLDKAKLDEAFKVNPDGVAVLLADANRRIGEVSARGQEQISRNGLPLQAGNGENPYIAQARINRFQALSQTQPTLLHYSPTTSNLYGLAQYLAVARL